jgi:hypothetical protein
MRCGVAGANIFLKATGYLTVTQYLCRPLAKV